MLLVCSKSSSSLYIKIVNHHPPKLVKLLAKSDRIALRFLTPLVTAGTLYQHSYWGVAIPALIPPVVDTFYSPIPTEDWNWYLLINAIVIVCFLIMYQASNTICHILCIVIQRYFLEDDVHCDRPIFILGEILCCGLSIMGCL
ncbi:unnamed protein product [Nezara viridula]|uniref:Uncharacterized protein n=1 Tax=Nezara viridula TaxID=85310 RepID=A0A9P0E3W3_NEZVI|nr:unnamed protein product [Nezara viridula]